MCTPSTKAPSSATYTASQFCEPGKNKAGSLAVIAQNAITAKLMHNRQCSHRPQIENEKSAFSSGFRRPHQLHPERVCPRADCTISERCPPMASHPKSGDRHRQFLGTGNRCSGDRHLSALCGRTQLQELRSCGWKGPTMQCMSPMRNQRWLLIYANISKDVRPLAYLGFHNKFCDVGHRILNCQLSNRICNASHSTPFRKWIVGKRCKCINTAFHWTINRTARIYRRQKH
jgi:hypothetical protein